MAANACETVDADGADISVDVRCVLLLSRLPALDSLSGTKGGCNDEDE